MAGRPLRAEFVYVVNEFGAGGYVSAFSIDPLPGPDVCSRFTVRSGSVRFNCGGPVRQICLRGQRHDNDISAYNINSATGSLTPVAVRHSKALSPRSVPWIPGRFAYVAAGDVSEYSIDPTTGPTPIRVHHSKWETRPIR
jgi:6-phosphogluconolactonase (cycloisomerase 2 family)